MEIKITKRTVLNEWNNTTCDGCEMLIHGRIYESENTFRRFKFVLYFCCDDIYDFFRNSEHYNENVTEEQNEIFFDEHFSEMKNEYINESITAMTDHIDPYSFGGYYDEFYFVCNETIENYNLRHSTTH